MSELGTLVEVDLREAWDHEARSFTPWLAGQIGRLSAAIGVPLEVEDTEVEVETFKADILARNAVDNSRILIENQLDVTNHAHLGQILTYLAGLDAKAVIWIASEFRPAHLSAIQWLNQHTVDPIAFFAVQIKVVRIGNSPLAPVFEVLARPNNWERQLQVKAQNAVRPVSDLGKFRRDFWSIHLERHPEESAHGRPTSASSRWRRIEGMDLCVSEYISQSGVGVFVRGLRGVDNGETFERLEPYEKAIEKAVGAPMGDGPDAYLFLTSKLGDVSDPASRLGLSDWLARTADRYEKALRKIVKD